MRAPCGVDAARVRREQLLSVPVESSPPLHLQVTLFMPSHGGPFPLVIVNHGASHDLRNTPRVADNFIPYYFLSRGYAVALPMMRGYAGSEGYPKPHGCDVAALGLDSARDIRKVLDLASIGMPSQEVDTEYLPDRARAASAYADINDLDAVPFLTDKQRDDVYRHFLAAPLPRAIAIGSTSAVYISGGFDPSLSAMDRCWKLTRYCQLYAVDNTVVWPRLESEPPSTKFAALTDVSAVPYLSERGRRMYTKFLSLRTPRAFAIAPDGAWGYAWGIDPINDALAYCANGHAGCRLYAVNRDVVWTGK
jgi:hypothetical protein